MLADRGVKVWRAFSFAWPAARRGAGRSGRGDVACTGPGRVRGPAAVLLLALGVGFALQDAAHAGVLVSNTGQSPHTSYTVANKTYAQGFTTGGGAELESIDVYFAGVTGFASDWGELAVAVWEADATDVAPGRLIATLETPSDQRGATDVVRTFAAPEDTHLKPNTNYFLVVRAGSILFSIHAVGGGEDSVGEDDWEILDNGLLGTTDPAEPWTRLENALAIRVNGILLPELSALEIEDASDDTPIRIFPAFDPATFTYKATVPVDVSEVTVAPTAGESDAALAYLDGDDAPIADANARKPGQQVSLAEGANTIKAKVTREDLSQTYTIVITRLSIDVECDATAVLCVGLTVGQAGVGAMGYITPAAGVGRDALNLGLLSADLFTLDGTDYVVESLRWPASENSGDRLHLTLDRDFPAAALGRLFLTVGTHEFALADAGRGNDRGTIENNYWWGGRPDELGTAAEGTQLVVQLLKAPTSDASLRRLSLRNVPGAPPYPGYAAEFDPSFPLSPGFTPGTTTGYSAEVPNATDEITVDARLKFSRDSLEFLDDTDTPVADANDSEDGHQVPLSEGANTIKVSVTTLDNRVRTYVVTVTRRPLMVLRNNSAHNHDEDVLLMVMSGTSVYSDGGVETAVRCLGRPFALMDEHGTALQNVAWTLDPWVRNDGWTSDGHTKFTMGSDGQVRTIVGEDYRFGGRFGATSFRVRGTDRDSGGYARMIVEARFMHPQTRPDYINADNSCVNPGLGEQQEGEPLRADFRDEPANHDGASVFMLNLWFSEDVEITPGDLRDHALSARGGSVTGVSRVSGAKDLFEVTVAPDGDGAVSVNLGPVPSDCTTAGAVCTADGVAFTGLLATRVDGPPPNIGRDDPSADATLSRLTLSGVDIGAFAAGTRSYAATVGNDVASTQVTATPKDSGASVTIADGDGSTAGRRRSVSLSEGTNTITVTVTAADGRTTATYTVTVTREAASTDATLSALTLSGIDIGTFAAGTTSYAATVGNDVSSTQVTATPKDAGASVTIADGDGSTAGTSRTVSLSEGTNTITVTVTAADGRTTATYTVTVTREAASTDATLSALTLSGIDIGTFAAGTTSYAATVGNDVSSTQVTATPKDSGASVAIADGDGSTAGTSRTVSLAEGSSTVTVTVTAEDGETTASYTVTVTRKAADAPLTASFGSAPTQHDGSSEFTVRLSFSEDVATSFRVLRDQALAASRGTVRKAKRVDGRNDLWTVHVEPSGNGAVTLTLDPATDDCAATGAVCTSDGRALSNAPSVTVDGPEADAPLTASFGSAPTQHDGSSEFTVRLSFSEDIATSFRVLRDQALAASGGTVRKAKRVDGRNDLWTVYVEPSGNGAVTLTLDPATDDCAVTGAVCTSDGRALSNAPSVTVNGPGAANASVNGPVVKLSWPSPRDDFGSPSGADYGVRVNGKARGVVSAELFGSTAWLTLELPVAAGDTVTVAYLASAMHPLAEATGQVRSGPWEGLAVENLTGAEDWSRPVVRVDWRPADPLASAASDALRLDASGLGLTDLWGMERLTALVRLDLSGNALADLSPLAGLTNLRDLDLSGNQVTDLWPLAALHNLERLNLADNGVTDVQALAGLPNLTVLLLAGNDVADAWPLSALDKLENLGLGGNRIGDVRAFQDLPHLRRLDLTGNPTTDLSPLGDVGSLVWLALPGHQIGASMETLGRLTRLGWVWVENVESISTSDLAIPQ